MGALQSRGGYACSESLHYLSPSLLIIPFTCFRLIPDVLPAQLLTRPVSELQVRRYDLLRQRRQIRELPPFDLDRRVYFDGTGERIDSPRGNVGLATTVHHMQI